MWTDKVKSMLYDDELTVTVVPAAHAAPAPIGQAASFSLPPVQHDDAIYQMLAKRTALESIPGMGAVYQAMESLAEFIPDKALRLRAALKQTQASTALSPEKVPALFDELESMLSQEKRSFDGQLKDQTDAQITAKLVQVTKIEAALQEKASEMATLNQQRDSLRAQVDVAKSKMESAKAAFVAAYNRRLAEIRNECQEFSSVIK